METIFLLLISMVLTTTIFSQAGTLDTTFGNSGIVHYYEEDIGIDVIGVGWFNSLVEQPDGKILATGLQSDDGIFWFDLYHTLSMRFNANGSLDSSLSPAGFLQNCGPSEEEGKSIAIQPDGKILIV
ncbi:MAG: hypothetical protein H7Y00_17010, partial [Fimbriimonadaceae bacterium]|nr:hypothetical protein [Chitinophagales bacterium]